MDDFIKYMKGFGNAALFFIAIIAIFWYIKQHFGKKWYIFWGITLYISLVAIFTG